MEKTIEEGKIAVVFFGSAEGDEFAAFEKAASQDDKRSFYYTSDEESAKAHGVTAPGIALFRPFDEPKVDFEGEILTNNIASYVSDNSIPTVIDFTDEYIEPIFQKPVSYTHLTLPTIYSV